MVSDLEQQALRKVIKKLLVVEGNVLSSSKIFAAKRIIEWIISVSKSPKVVDSFVLDLLKHLEGTSKVAWMDEIFSKLESGLYDYNKQKQKKDTRSNAKNG